MKHLGIFFLSFLFFTSLVLSTDVLGAEEQPTPPTKTLTLKEAVTAGLQKNPLVNESKEKVNQGEQEIPLARSYVFPTLSFNWSDYRKKNSIGANDGKDVLFGGDPYNQYNSGVHLNQTLFQIGSISAISSAKKARDINKLDSQITTRDTTGNIISAYYQVVLNSRNVEALLEQQKIVQESLITIQKRERNGRAQLLDVLQIKTQAAALEGQISDAKNQLQVAVAQLANLLGSHDNPVLQIKDSLQAPHLKQIDNEIDFKNYKIPELEKDDLLLGQIEDKKQVALGQNLPNLALIGDYSFQSYTKSDLYDSPSKSWSVGVLLTVPLFSGFSSIYQQKSLTSQHVQVQFDRQNVQNQVNLNQVTSRKKLESARDSILTDVEALKLATKSSTEARRAFRFATIDALHFLTVQQSYVQAEQALDIAKYNYIVALANYYTAYGQDMLSLVDLLEKANQ